MSRVRCAIYTRKSSDEGLDQEFNSLDAQHEACKSYIASQRHEGWTLIRDRYDDGGFSGGSMERPGLTALLADVSAGKVDVVVIYKIDRLTRSLADFARIMDILEKSGASFVSVTQSFNTKTSMGRLMLHVLLSFAQFEREVGAERVRDKIAASKAKGMWMGGTVPLGYHAVERKLVVNEAEARTVRVIMARFVETRSVPATLRWAREQGLRTKRRQRAGQPSGGNLFHYGALRGLLSNRTYVGEIEHKGRIHAGQHDAIVERELFHEVQAIISTLSLESMHGPRLTSASLLQGLIVDRHDRRMGPVHTRRSGQRYRYYATHPSAMSEGGEPPYRLPANQLERLCCELLAAHFANQVSSFDDAAAARELARTLANPSSRESRQIFIEQVRCVTIGDGMLEMTIVDGTRIECSVERLRHGNDAKLIVGDVLKAESRADPQLVKLLQDAHRARALALAKPNQPVEKLAKAFGRSTMRYKRLLRLSYLSPKIVASILEGTQPQTMTGRFLQNLDGLPIGWTEQEAMLLT